MLLRGQRSANCKFLPRSLRFGATVPREVHYSSFTPSLGVPANLSKRTDRFRRTSSSNLAWFSREKPCTACVSNVGQILFPASNDDIPDRRFQKVAEGSGSGNTALGTGSKEERKDSWCARSSRKLAIPEKFSRLTAVPSSFEWYIGATSGCRSTVSILSSGERVNTVAFNLPPILQRERETQRRGGTEGEERVRLDCRSSFYDS